MSKKRKGKFALRSLFFKTPVNYLCISGEPLQAITKRIFASDRKLNCLIHYRFCFLNFVRKVPGIIGESQIMCIFENSVQNSKCNFWIFNEENCPTFAWI